MQVLARLVAAMLLVAVCGCSKGSDQEIAGTSTSQAQLAATEQTPLFRNLGKRGDSDL